MKKLVFCMILSALLLIPLAANSAPVETIIDDGSYSGAAYWGGTVVNAGSKAYGDVIGNPYFSIDRMKVIQDGNSWEITILGDYFYYRTTGQDNGLPRNLMPGDLYISSNGWEARSPHEETDTFDSSEGWDYIIPIGENGTALGVTYSSSIYALNYAGITMTNVNSLTGNYVYRSNQAWDGGETGNSFGLASYTFLSGPKISDYALKIAFDATKLDIGSGTVGFHWTMQCGNDVVRGLVPAADTPSVPEPSTLLLLGLGLTGVAVYKKFRS